MNSLYPWGNQCIASQGMSARFILAPLHDKDIPMIELTLPDMTCGHCVKTVTSTVQKLDPTATVQTDLGTHQVRIESTQPEAALRSALAEEGYPAA